MERVCGGDPLYLGGEGGVRQDVHAVDALHTPSTGGQVHLALSDNGLVGLYN